MQHDERGKAVRVLSSPPASEGDGGRGLRPVGVVAVALAAFVFGWLLRSSTPEETEPTQAVLPTVAPTAAPSTAPLVETSSANATVATVNEFTLVDPALVDAADIEPTSAFDGAPTGGDISLDLPTRRLALGKRTTLPESPRLDFLNTVCHEICLRDAVVVDANGEHGAWTAGAPFHVRHGFINDAETPLSDEFEVVVYVTRRTDPFFLGLEAAPSGYEMDHTYRFSSDFVLRGVADRCGPGYWDQTTSQTCEWFVHEFPEGLPQGRYDIWAKWFAQCSAWQHLGIVGICFDEGEILTRFASSVNMPFNPPETAEASTNPSP